MTRPADIFDQLSEIAASLRGNTGYPDWFTQLCSKNGVGAAWFYIIEGALAEIRVNRRGGGDDELEAMRALAGRLLRRLESGEADVAFLERSREEMEEAEE
jgi:hypothetical protein